MLQLTECKRSGDVGRPMISLAMQIPTSDDKLLQKIHARCLTCSSIFLQGETRSEQQQKMNTSEPTVILKKTGSWADFQISPWPVFWTVVGAWMWFGILHLARIV